MSWIFRTYILYFSMIYGGVKVFRSSIFYFVNFKWIPFAALQNTRRTCGFGLVKYVVGLAVWAESFPAAPFIILAGFSDGPAACLTRAESQINSFTVNFECRVCGIRLRGRVVTVAVSVCVVVLFSFW